MEKLQAMGAGRAKLKGIHVFSFCKVETDEARELMYKADAIGRFRAKLIATGEATAEKILELHDSFCFSKKA